MHPYKNLPPTSFWKQAVAGLADAQVDPVIDVPFRIAPGDAVATAGSCFAQHISRTLVKQGFHYLVTEPGPLSEGAVDEGYGVFPARFANIYTVRQLRQLFDRAFGLFEPEDSVWRRDDGAWVDPFRPRVQQGGFASAEAMLIDRMEHLAAVRRMFETCNVFIFTLGLTEGWASVRDGAVVPLPPGVAGEGSLGNYRFENFRVAGMVDDLLHVLDCIRAINPGVRVILTVSPVPLVATYEPCHVLVSNTYSKSALRVVAETVSIEAPGVAYFPSYEIITGPQARSRFFEDDLRSVTSAGVEQVMGIFARHFLGSAQEPASPVPSGPEQVSGGLVDDRLRQEMSEVVCDEEALDT